MKIPPPDAAQIESRLVNGLDDYEFEIPGHAVADVALVGEPERQQDGSIVLALKALTVVE